MEVLSGEGGAGFLEQLEIVLGDAAGRVERDVEISLEAETQIVWRSSEFPPFWLCDPDMGSSDKPEDSMMEDGDYTLI